MAERKTRGHVYSIEEAIERTLSQPRELDIGLSSLTPDGGFAEVAEDVFEEILEEARDYEELPRDDEDFEEDFSEDFDENFDEEMAEYLAEHGEETTVVKLPEARPVARRRRTFLSTEGEHVKLNQNGPKAGKKIKETVTGVGGKVKSFFKESVAPLFFETEEVVVQNDEFEDEILDDYDEEENTPSFSAMYASAKDGATGFFSRVGDFFNNKVINPIKEKIIENEEDNFEDVEVITPETRREGLHVIDHRRSVPMDAEYSDVDEEDDFYEEEEEEPSWVQKLLDRFLNPEDDLEEDVYYEEEDDDPGLIETVREFFRNRKETNRTEVVDEKPKSKLADKIRSFFYDDEEYDEEEVLAVEEVYPEEDEEDYSSYSVPDPKIYDEIIQERVRQQEENN